MKKIVVFLFAMLLFLPLFGQNIQANPTTSGSVHYLYITPGDNGKVVFLHEFYYDNSTGAVINPVESGSVFDFPIPAEATDIQAVEGTTLSDGKILYNQPVDIDEEMKASYQYSISMATSADFIYQTPLPNTTELVIFIPEGKGALTSSDIKIYMNSEPMKIKDTYYNIFQVTGLTSGKDYKINYDQSKVPVRSETDSSDTNKVSNVTRSAPQFHSPGHIRIWNESILNRFEPHILLGSLLLIAIIFTGYYSYYRFKERERRNLQLSNTDEQEFQMLVVKKKAILAKITQLEEAFERGEINDKAYAAKQQAYRELLIEVSRSLRKYTD